MFAMFALPFDCPSKLWALEASFALYLSAVGLLIH